MIKVGMVDRALAFWGLGQVSVTIKGPTGVLYVDPYLTDSDGEGGRLERSFPPPLEPEEVINASAVLLRACANRRVANASTGNETTV
jgi:L-ascorbate metabolism protein UlaG (beta-lactamase superfamily)